MKTMLSLLAMLVCLGVSAQDDQQHDAQLTAAKEAEEAREHRLAEAQERLAKAQERFAEAAKTVADITAERVREWRPKQAFLGVLIARHDEDGIRVAGVSPDSGAEVAGIETDDVIVAIGEESLLGSDWPLKILYGVLDDTSPGDSVELVVLRDGEEHRFDVATTAYAANPGKRWQWQGSFGDLDWPGKGFLWRRDDGPKLVEMEVGRHGALKLADIGEDLGDYFGVDAGVLVLDTPAGSELKPGDILKRIAGAAVSSSDDAYGLLKSLEAEAEAEVRRKNRKVVVNVEPLGADIFSREMIIELEDEE